MIVSRLVPVMSWISYRHDDKSNNSNNTTDESLFCFFFFPRIE